ncbi:TonB-dependent receptor domain-containing protein [Pleionea sp. CnH1-48]|uniref:TonB-dependent receptor domain-containing protein n=1 Tax=Pleionea sp. CnH1-48 TaxID=2954494 RepID=UPI002096B85C|nr:TonB-dependent receptor [Pleionea sp. CnH1-48]MCO7223059.1 TonB-dependent receptor [Pleionea sp. CnH1-48]
MKTYLPYFKVGLIPLVLSSALSISYSNSAIAEEAKEERLVVTGSKIRRSEVVGNSPIQILSREDIEKTGLTSVADILQRMSSSGAALNTRFNSSGNFGMPSDGGGVGAGAAEVDMRHLGSKRVLILVDGKRWVNGSSASGVSSAVDVNTIPLAIVDRIEVLEDGASTIYGSDAIAGVINIITRTDIDSWQLNASYGGFGNTPVSLDDGFTSSFDFFAGAQGERHNVVMSISHVNQNVVYSQNRSTADLPLFGTGNTRGSSATPFGRFLFTDANGNTVNTTPNGLGGSLNFPDDFHDFTNDDRFNYAAFNLYVTPSERTNIFSRIRYDMSTDVTFYAMTLYNNRKSRNQAAPEPIFIGPEAGTGGIADTVSIDITNPYNPFGLTLDENNFVFAGRRPIEAGPRSYRQNVDTSYIATGFEGSFDSGDNAYYWDVNFAWGKNRGSQIKTGALNAARIKLALGPVADCNADPLCVPLNIFGYGSITQDMLDYISFTQKDFSENNTQIFSANINGDLFELPAGYVGFAAGMEHRKRSGFFQPDAVAASGETMGIPASPTDGGFTVDEYFLETNIPLLSDVAGAEKLELSLAVRKSEYASTAGSRFEKTTSKYGILWRPNEQLTFRANVSEGFRAPSIGELFATGARNDTSITDPCNTTDANVRTRCEQIWGTMDFSALAALGQTQISVLTSGNHNLQPEESDSVNWGVVYSPDWFDNSQTISALTFEFTAYDIEMEEAIQPIDAADQLNRCVGGNNDDFCVGIDRANGISITNFDNSLRNIGGIETAGTDFKVMLSTQELEWGRLNVTWKNTFVEHYRTEVLGVNSGDIDGTEFGSNPDRAVPEWKFDLALDWTHGDWSANTTVRYLSKIYERCSDFLDGTPNSLANLGLCSDPDLNNNANSVNVMDETYYVDVQVGYSSELFGAKIDYAIGARNLFEQDPPLCTQCDLNSYLPGLYDPQGRYWYLKFTMRP